MFAFGAISGIGLALDFGIFTLLVYAGLPSGWANAISATCAVTFVYFASVSRVFSYHGRFLLPLFMAYLGYQVVAVAAASFAVGYLAQVMPSPLLAKLAILPVTFSANFLFMYALTRRRVADVGEGV